MSDHSSGAEQGALPPADGGPSTPTRVPTVVGVERSPMQIAQVIGGQYIITSQSQAGVPPLTQIVSNPPVSPINSRIINIASISRTPNLSNQSIVNALTKPRTSNVRAQLFPSSGDPSEAGSSHVSSSGISRISPGSSPARKRSRADELPPGCENLSGSRARAMEHKWARSKCIKESYYEHIAELYFLETSGNMLDYYAWRKKPRTSHYTSYLLKHQLDASDLSQEETPSQPQISHQAHQQQMQVARLTSPKMEAPAAVTQSTSAVSTIGTGTLLAAPITQPENTVKVPEVSNLMPIVSVHSPSVMTTTAVSTAIVTSIAASKPTPTTSVNTVTKTKSIVSSLSGGNQEQIVEKAKQEAYVMQRVSELQKEGLWTERRLPKVQETARCKSHWDYLLEEMVWLAADFAQERKWKKAAAKKCARMVQKYFQDKALAAQKAEKAQELQLRRIASFIAKEIKTFWSNVEKLVEFKQQTRLEEKRKKALDQHLSFIVDQTEKYSQLLAKDMNKSLPEPQSTSINSSRVPSPHSDDDEFRPDDNSSDDEETIAQAEAADEKEEQSEEVAALQRESEMNLEDFLNELPENYLEMRDKIKLSESENEQEEEDNEKSSSKTEVSETKKKASKDDEFTVDSEEESEDDEDTIMEQEEKEGDVDHKQELDELQAENEMSIEELMKKYSGPPLTEDDKMSVDEEPEEESEESTEEEDEEEQSEEEESEEEEKGSDEEVGLKSLLEDETNSGEKNKTEGDDDHLINDVAAIAESIQPKGNTLSSTNVVTPVPFLLKHSLREYQHIGLDWLVTMFERKLNGILADEMGLGKTIQTIALLAHLACVKGDWGPHLIIVPTSVMLNWEMECKKWCPGFKILTYYGTQKERKLKRTGWTKPNAFHICITSYKLVIQDHQSFRRKKWKYLILDEAQNIKNFKSQRWQLLLNFQTQQRLLLTGTPLQNNLMELWSLMHFLMPNVFQSHREFREWFSNPVTGMIEGNSEYNESIIKRLHKVLRPFLLRRLKSEVEKQMPKKFEHIVMCRLSKRQRFLYDDYMSRAKTKETLASGNLLSVINVLMQLRKVCNHPNLFEVRPTVSPFKMEGIVYNIPSLVYSLLDMELFERVDFNTLHLQLMNLELTLTAYGAYRTCKYRAPGKLIECIDSAPEPPPKCPPGLVRMRVKMGEPSKVVSPGRLGALIKPASPGKSGSSQVKVTGSPVQQGLKLRVTGPTGAPLQGYSVQLVQHHGSVKAIPVATLSSGQAAAVTNPPLALKPMGGAIKTEQRVSVGGFAQLVQTPMGKHILLTQSAALPAASTVAIGTTTTVMTSSGQRLTVLSKPVTNVTTSITTSPVKTIVNSTPAVSTTTSVVFSTHSDTITTTATSDATTNSVDSNVPISITRPLTASLVQQLKSNAPVTSNSTGSNKKRSPSVDEKKEEPEKIDPLKVSYNERVQLCREHKLAIILRFNEWRCQASPMYGGDLRESLTMKERATSYNQWTGAYLTLQQAASKYKQWQHGKSIQELVHTPTDYVNELMDLFHRYVFCVPAVFAPAPTYRVLNPPQAKYWTEQRDVYKLQQELSPKAAVLHPIASAMVTQFPDPRLIQYDCGKLQTLDLLLRKLKVGGHRVLIFTQMTRMLDVLEAFLNFHGHIYLRLDGTTKVDQRQVLMERFNGDKRIFAFILSTRSGGVGVNLTGADTVIFYDSDWNPTMDAQAQDRCHRIGQTRDVHIYRLVSEKTIEENILKKANQKRMLGDLAIEGGNFTTAYFKSSTIQDLFNVDASEEDASARMDLPKARPAEPVAAAPAANEDRAALGALESALAACEDDQDVQAARTAKAEAVADLAEFDESIPLEEGAEKEEMSKAEIEVQNLIKQLTPVERYAMRFVEETEAAWSAEQLAAAEREIEEQKREWEENRLAALRKEEERRKGNLDEEAELLTFSREDSTNQIWLSYNNQEQMPIWCPPTPPQQDTDVYVDYTMGFLYEMSVMSESQLPPVYIRKESNKRSRHEAGLSLDATGGRRAIKVSRKDDVYEPRSLFDRPSPEMMKMRREMKQQRYRGIIRPQIPKSGLKLTTLNKPQPDPPCWHNWTIHEDMSLLKVVQTFQGLPLNLTIVSPGHTANWDFAADYVNTTSITYRSPKQCRHRYETVLINREEGKILYDTTSRKKKNKNIYTKFPQQIKSNRPMRTAQLYTQDNNSTFSQLMITRFDALKQISQKRPVSSKPPAANPLMKNPKHTAVLTECGIDYERPLMPTEVAARRTDRLREKQKLENARKASTSATTQPAVSQSTSAVPVSPSTSSVQNTATVVSTQQTVAVSVANIQAPGTPPGTIRTQRIVASPMQSTAVVSVAVTGQAVTKTPVSGTATVAATSKTITPAQLQFYRQQALKQQMKLQAAGLQAQTVKGAVTIAGQPTAVQVAVTQTGQQRTQFVRQAAVTVATGGKQGITRAVSETEMAALIKRQQQLQQQKALQAAAQAQANQQGTTVQTLTQAQQAQILAQAGIQFNLQVQQSGSGQQTQVATLVKAVSAAPTSTVTIPVSIGAGKTVQGSPTAATIKPQQLRQLQIHQQLLAQKKLTGQKITQLAQVAGKAGVATQLIVQAPKTIPAAMTVQQLQQVMRQGPPQLAVSQGQVVLAKAGPAGRVIPVNTGQAGLKQTIQVVTATTQGLATGIRPQGTSTLAGALAGTIKVAPSTSSTQQQAILSQVSAALQQGQPVTVRQSGSPVRIQTSTGTPLVAVTVQSGSAQQQATSGTEQVGIPRFQKKLQ